PGAVVQSHAEPARADAHAQYADDPDEELLEELEEESLEDDEDAQDADDLAYVDGGDDGGAEDVIIVDDEDERPRAREPSQRPQSGSVLPPEIAREAQIAKLLTECEVFLRYGLKQKVLDQLRRVLELDPMHVEARERLKDLLVERGDLDGAIGELFVLADLFAGQRPPVAILYLRQILELDPENPDAHERIDALSALGTESQRPSARAETSGAELNRAEITAPEITDPGDLGGTGPMASGSEAMLDGEPEEGVFFVDDEEATASTHGLDPLHDSDSGLDRTDSDRRVAMPPPPSSVAEASAGDPLAPISPEEFESVPLRPSAPDVVADQAARMSMPPGEVEELLDEADFFVAQGLYEEARAILRDSLAAHPRNLLIADKIAEIDDIAAQSQSQARSVPPAASSDDLSFELAEKLADDLGQAEQQERDAGSGVLDVEQVFAQFKKGVEQQVGLEDTETHFDLGIAYKEMGLLQDAIAEFQLCLVNPQKQCTAHTMIGLCQLEKGEVSDAIGQFKKGLYVENKTDREELGLYYELGRAYELLHDPKEALYYLEKVRKRDPSFRNVNDRIIALTRPSPAAAPAVANDDIDAAFDDLMGDRES
ncbi:MAG: tetratricopeptide repeat protein, partial [Myxococcota bacterium]|nr:tetratricopeptide repeat protein [Myxococcota bacterium]